MDLPRWLATALPQALRGEPGEGDAAAETGWLANLLAFRRLVFVHVAVRNYLIWLPKVEAVGPVDWLETLVRWSAIAVALSGQIPGFGCWAARLAIPVILCDVVLTLPDSTNHVAVELALLFLFALLDERKRDEGRLLVSSVRWFVAVFFLYTGVQKMLYGYYFQGQFLAYAAATEERFRVLFQWFVPEGEMARLVAFNERLLDPGPGKWQPRVGAGPYLVDSMLFKLVSNSVYLFEIVAGAALAVPRLRTAATLAAMGFVVLIELGARELTFGLLMMNLLCLFFEGTWNRRAFWVLIAGYASLIVISHTDAFWYSPA